MSASYLPESRRREPPGLGGALVVVLGLLAVIWVLEVVDRLSRGALDAFGIEPRRFDDAWTILTAPWLHGGFGHLASNSVPFVVLGALVLMDGWRRFLVTTAVVVVASGVLVWLLAPPGSTTLGASGVVFGWLLYVLLRGVFTRSPSQVASGVVVFLVWGGLLWGVLPQQVGVSWQAHLGGAVGGVLAAVRAGDRRPRRLEQPARW
jgi:membrane associated rhomboid family serine protease